MFVLKKKYFLIIESIKNIDLKNIKKRNKFTIIYRNLRNPEKQPQAGCVFSITGLRSKGIPQIRYQG